MVVDHCLEDDDDEMSEDGSDGYDDGGAQDLMAQAMEDEVTAQLAAAGQL